MNTAKRQLADLLDGLIKMTHILAAVFAVRIFVELSDPTNTVPAAVIILGIVGIGIADLIITLPLKRISNVIRSITYL
ncbi:hypothetical protein ACH492_22220 [Streptomyces sp. NPDC019443]|uniref:hypothetical protein n=1 Tax=Streptomyces sp. NPDC019443 TaxID=3365061 RepID=UPI0037B1B38B